MLLFWEIVCTLIILAIEVKHCRIEPRYKQFKSEFHLSINYKLAIKIIGF